MPLAAITFIRINFDCAKTDFPGVGLLAVICGKTYKNYYFASLMFTELYNKIESLECEKYACEYNVLTLKICAGQFKGRYFEVVPVIGLNFYNNNFITNLVFVVENILARQLPSCFRGLFFYPILKFLQNDPVA